MRRTLLALPLLLLLLLAGPAAAHTALRSASPAAGSTVDAVTQVVLEFTDTVQPGFSTVAVTGADGVDRSQGDPVLQDGTRVLQELSAPLDPGRWTVAYRVVAADGHPIVGSHVFDVAAPAAPAEPTAAPETPAPTAAAEPTPQPSSEEPSPAPTDEAAPSAGAEGSGVPLLPAAVGGLLLAGTAGVLISRRGSASGAS